MPNIIANTAAGPKEMILAKIIHADLPPEPLCSSKLLLIRSLSIQSNPSMKPIQIISMKISGICQFIKSPSSGLNWNGRGTSPPIITQITLTNASR